MDHICIHNGSFRSGIRGKGGMGVRSRQALMAIGLAVLGGGCSDPVKDAKDRLAIVEKGGSSADICKAQRAVADAQLQAKNEKDYPLAKLTADIACNHAKLEAAYGSGDAALMADKLEAEAAP